MIDRCNSDKCHCPRCLPAREQAEKILDARIDWRIAMNERDRERREARKYQASQDVPTWNDLDRERRRAAAHERWRASSWIWFHGKLGFQRMDKRSRRKFGPIYRTPAERDEQSRHGTITNPFDGRGTIKSGETWPGRPMPPAMTEEAYLSAKEMSDWWFAHNWGPCKDCGWLHKTGDCQKPVTYTLNLSQWGEPHNPEKPMLTDLALSILFRIANREALSLAGTSGYCDAVSELSNKKLIEFRNSGTHITARGEVLMAAIRKLPLPERIENWAMPKS